MDTFKNWVMQNHHLTSVSTVLQFFARQIFFYTEPISGKYTMSNLHQYCAYTQDPQSLKLALRLIKDYDLDYEVHFGRTRFWVIANTELDTYCAMRFTNIDHETDHSLGR